jgi:hypothetical protein
MNHKLDTSLVEELIREVLDAHAEAWTDQNDKYEMEYTMTMTFQKIPYENLKEHGIDIDKANVDVAYLRLHRHIRPKGADEKETDTMLIYHQFHTFRNLQERVDEKAPWKLNLLIDLMAKLMTAGVEYSELMWRMKNQYRMEKAAVQEEKENKLDLVITNEMPQELPGDAEYKQWAKKNNEHGT